MSALVASPSPSTEPDSAGLLALGRSMKTLGPSLIAAAVCLRARGEKAELELQGRLRAPLLHVSVVLLLGKVRKSKSQSRRSQAS